MKEILTEQFHDSHNDTLIESMKLFHTKVLEGQKEEILTSLTNIFQSHLIVQGMIMTK